jgi:hypothetical protein
MSRLADHERVCPLLAAARTSVRQAIKASRTGHRSDDHGRDECRTSAGGGTNSQTGKSRMNDDDEIDRDSAPPSAERKSNLANAGKPPKRWHKGMESPNKAGRPKNPRNAAEVRELAREKTGAMLQFLSRAALNPKVSMNVRVQAATEILNRGWGKPNQSMDINHGIQDGLAALLEEIDGRNKIKVIEGAVIRPALEVKQPLLDHGQGREENPIPTELGSRKSSE